MSSGVLGTENIATWRSEPTKPGGPVRLPALQFPGLLPEASVSNDAGASAGTYMSAGCCQHTVYAPFFLCLLCANVAVVC
jgi:hypothetical protein